MSADCVYPAAMSDASNARAFYETTARILIHAFALGVALQLFWLAMLTGLDKQWVVDFHNRIIGASITVDQFVMISYVGLFALKMFCLCVFLIPWLAIRWALKQQPASG